MAQQPAGADEIDPALVHLDDDELEAIKVDLEQRLARFQKAFFLQHGRNPNEEERAPAKPAIKKYRGVGAEIARRQKLRAQLQANKRLKSAIAVTELAVGASQDRPSQLVRSSTARAAIDATEKMARFTSTLGGSATLTLFFEWGQYTAIWADVSLATAVMMKEKNPGINLGVLGSWIGYLEGTVWRWVQIFNLDIEAFRANFDIAFLAAVGWREVHLLCTVILPFLISGVTVLLLKSLGEIARLALITSAALLFVFGTSCHFLLAQGRAIRDTEEGQILGINQENLNIVLGVGGASFLASVTIMVYMRVITYRMVRKYLEREVQELEEKLYQVKNSLEAKAGGEAMPNASDLKAILEKDDHEKDFVGGRAKDVEEYARQMHERELHKSNRVNLPTLSAFMKWVSMWLFFSLGALLLWLRVFEMLPAVVNQYLTEQYKAMYWAGAGICTSFAGLMLLYMLATMTTTGQEVVDYVSQALRATYIGFLLVVVIVFYIPVSKAAISVFVCKDRQCGLGEWFPVQSPGTDATIVTYLTNFAGTAIKDLVLSELQPGNNLTTSDAVFDLGPATSCQACQWLSGPGTIVDSEGRLRSMCPAYLSDALCAPSTSLRLSASPAISCSQQWPYYIPGAVLTLIMFTLGVPYMFYQLTNRHSKMYESLPIYADKQKRGRRGAKHEAEVLAAATVDQGWYARNLSDPMYLKFTRWEVDDLWLRRVRRAKSNRAKNLYADFEYAWRYWKLVMLAVKFSVVLVDRLTPIFPSPLIGPVLLLGIHSFMFILSVYARPYIDKRPDLFAISLSMANMFNFVLLVVFAMRIPVPDWMGWILLVVNVVFPILSLFIGYCLNDRKARNLQSHLQDVPGRKEYLGEDKVLAERKSVERHINDFTLRFISKWTWGVLISCILCGELIFIGTFAEAALSPVTGHTASQVAITGVVDCYKEDYARAQEFIGFHDWRNFTASCCCMSRSNSSSLEDPDFGTHAVELWACTRPSRSTGISSVLYKERHRRSLRPGSTIAPVRKFCSPHFRNPRSANPDADSGVEPVWDDALEKLGVWTYFSNGTRDTFYDDYW